MADTTLRSLLEEHPEWADLPIVVYRVDGGYDWVGHSGMAYTGTDVDDYGDETEVLVMAGN